MEVAKAAGSVPGPSAVLCCVVSLDGVDAGSFKCCQEDEGRREKDGSCYCILPCSLTRGSGREDPGERRGGKRGTVFALSFVFDSPAPIFSSRFEPSTLDSNSNSRSGRKSNGVNHLIGYIDTIYVPRGLKRRL